MPVQRNAKARALPEPGYLFTLRHLGDGEPAYVGSTCGQANLLMEAGSVTSPAINRHDFLKFEALGVGAGISGVAFGQGQRSCANPSGVLGPVLAPPCIRQRPFRMVGPLQGAPCLVFAPHLGALLGSPGGFPFFSQPLRGAWGSLSAFCTSPSSLPPICRLVLADSPNNRLPSFVNMDMPDNHPLLPSPS
jgi:hypothetical protein